MARTKYIVMHAEDTFSPLFWDDDDAGIGDVDSLDIDDEEISLSSLIGLKEWFIQADKYDPYTDVSKFTTEGMEEWINNGYEYALQVNKILPKDIDLYYGYWHQFGDGKWRFCKAYLSKERKRRKEMAL